MNKVIKERLEEIVALMNDPEITVIEKEVKEKLESILELLNHPEEFAMEKQEHKKKLEKVAVLVKNARVDPDIEIEYCALDGSNDPYVLVTYVVSKYTKPTRKISIGDAMLQRTPEDIVNQITFSIAEFKSEIDSVEMG
ncbi:MAG TPA: hypothetical protein PLM93_02265 [Sulfuricurvum sp.]|nr:MAG: hypothetical protein B7Y30_08095 [Campylobacterales bacterium 16-40-21]OZA03995.1 MAG: hypothetical protein B7X89_00120 [Sulfuricurvum sp. 17-40-25]HQS65995.1 hypothetical protein [Sulfuricurvum sp.]HQT37038.1 hypothetical protein [Sulfuricurvum sp.]